LASAAAPKTTPTVWKAGAARVDLTPDDPVWMGGYAGRKKPSEGFAQRIYAKALAIEDAGGKPFVFVTLDLVSIPRRLRDDVAQRIEAAHGVPPGSLLFNASHTHAAPELRLAEERTPYVMPPPLWQRLLKFRAGGGGEARDGDRSGPRRAGAGVAGVRPRAGGFRDEPAAAAAGRRLCQPAVSRRAGRPRRARAARCGCRRQGEALLFGYACHNTTVGSYRLSGDYAGHAQHFLEKDYPGAVALFVQGAGGDQNPYPRQTMQAGYADEDLARLHGRTLATAVEAALVTPLRELRGPLRAGYSLLGLKYSYLPAAELAAGLQSAKGDVKARAEMQQKRQAAGELPPAYPNPVQVVRIGDDFVFAAIGQEVVVDYALRSEAGAAVDSGRMDCRLFERCRRLSRQPARARRRRLRGRRCQCHGGPPGPVCAVRRRRRGRGGAPAGETTAALRPGRPHEVHRSREAPL
jgi:neutral ceramidase